MNMKTHYRKLDTSIFEKSWTNKNGRRKKTLYFKITVNRITVACNAYDPDKPHRAPTSLAEAKVCRDKIRLRLASGQPAKGEIFSPQQGGISFKEFVDEVYIPFSSANHRTHDRYMHFLNVLLPFFGGMKISSISPFDVERFKFEQMKRVK